MAFSRLHRGDSEASARPAGAEGDSGSHVQGRQESLGRLIGVGVRIALAAGVIAVLRRWYGAERVSMSHTSRTEGVTWEVAEGYSVNRLYDQMAQRDLRARKRTGMGRVGKVTLHVAPRLRTVRDIIATFYELGHIAHPLGNGLKWHVLDWAGYRDRTARDGSVVLQQRDRWHHSVTATAYDRAVILEELSAWVWARPWLKGLGLWDEEEFRRALATYFTRGNAHESLVGGIVSRQFRARGAPHPDAQAAFYRYFTSDRLEEWTQAILWGRCMICHSPARFADLGCAEVVAATCGVEKNPQFRWQRQELWDAMKVCARGLLAGTAYQQYAKAWKKMQMTHSLPTTEDAIIELITEQRG